MVSTPPNSDSRYVDPHAGADERTWAMFNHLVGLLSLTGGFAAGGIIATLIMWQIKKSQSPFLDDHGRDALNFQISLLVYFIGVTAILVPTLGIGSVGYLALTVLTCVGTVRGAIAANKGEYYRYPATIRFIKPTGLA